MANNTIYGIDVSHNNGTVDWEKVQSSDPANAFAFIKATEGVGYTDPMCMTNATAITQKTKIRFGYYHFASLNNATDVSKDATDEANWFVQTMQTMPEASIVPVLDIERNDSKLTPQQVQEWISAFMTQMDVLGFPKVILYSYVSFLNDNLPADHPFGTLPLWIAHYTSNASPTIPKGWTNYTLWQYSASGAVNGVSTQCDLDKGDADVLQQLKPVQRPSRSHTRPGQSPAKTLFPAPPQPTASAPASSTTTAAPSAQADTAQHSLLHKPEKNNAEPLVSVKKKKNRRFVFFGLKLGRLLFIGVMYGRPDEEMKDQEE
jgi:GH25 family lysozyme M1 (1,4-beta-N-acetylmuramidase)